MSTVSLIVQALRADMMVVFALLLRMAYAVVKTWVFKKVAITRPNIIDELRIISIEYTYTIGQYSDMAHPDGSGCACILLRIQCDLVAEVLVLCYVGIIPWADAIAWYTEAAHIDISSGVLYLDTVGWDIAISSVCY